MPRIKNTATLGIEFQKPGDPTRTKILNFSIVDTLPSNMWLDLLEQQMAHEQYTGPEFRITSTQFLDADKISQELCSLVAHINHNYGPKGFELPLWKHPMEGELDDQIETLNRLHEAFHRQEDRQERDGKSEPKFFEKLDTRAERLAFSRLIQNVNVKIHELEESLYTQNKTRHQSYAVTYTGGIPHHKKRRVEIPDHWRDFFTDDPAERSCYLTASYSTIGKDLYTCVMNNDVELVKSGMVSPKLDISAEFIINMKDRETYDFEQLNQSHQMRATYNMVKWVLDNDLMDYIDLREKKHFYPSQCVLGFLDSTISRKEFDTLIAKWDVTRLILDRTKTDA